MTNKKPTPEEIFRALCHDGETPDPLENLIATGEAVFNLLRISELDHLAKNAFYQLEKMFGFYARLATGEGEH